MKKHSPSLNKETNKDTNKDAPKNATKELAPQPLSTKEKLVLEFLESRIQETGVSPSYQEIKDHFGFASFNSVQNYLKQLSLKGYIAQNLNQKRAIQILHSSHSVQEKLRQIAKPSSNFISNSSLDSHLSSQEASREMLLQTPRGELLSLPLLGRVAAGLPIEEMEHDEYIDVPASMLRNPHKSFALKIKGQSMIDDGIFDGDIILVQKQANASNGEIVVASIDGESTVKRIYAQNNKIELRPANTSMQSMWYLPQQIQIQGVVVGLLRRF
jgi:repressor LexA